MSVTTILRRRDMHQYQNFCVQHLIENPYAALFVGLGMGKSISTLTALVDLIESGDARKILVVAPLRVAQHTWPMEVQKWRHTKHLTVSVCVGTEKQRLKALKAKADIYTINRENVPWLVGLYLKKWPFDTVVLDEMSSFKNHQSSRFKALKTIRPQIKRVIGLTGTPASNSLLDLWSQLYLLDQGDRLFKNIGQYRKKYFNEGQKNDHVVYDWSLKKGDSLLGKEIYQREIYEKIGDICISLKAEDWLDLPKVLEREIVVEMPKSVKANYERFERDAVLEFQGEEITAASAVALSNKLLQFANGAIYKDLDKREFTEIHDLKLKALEEILEAANGNPVLCFYKYKHDVERIQKVLKKYGPHKLGKGSGDIDRWNNGEISFLLAHPASAGHGLNMQDGGHLIVWFGLPWSLELFQQGNARLNRQGQKQSVIIQKIKVLGTMDEDVIDALERKDDSQERLMQAVKAKIKKYEV